MKRYLPLLLLLILPIIHLSWPEVSTAASGIFKITRFQLYFDNRRAETVVKKNHSSLKAYAEIKFKGSGLLQGFWEVDGRILSHVKRHIVAGNSATITIETADTPELPTFESGTHRLRFVVTDPTPAIALPEAIYFVAAKTVTPLPVKIIYPQPQSEVPYSSATFKWKGTEDSASYLIIFYQDQEKPIFSAHTRDLDYQLPPSVLKNSFIPGQEYLWKIVSFDASHNKVGASPTNKFTFTSEHR